MDAPALSQFVFVGTSHQIAPAAIRETLVPTPALLENLRQEVMQGQNIEEIVLLNTCTRTEIYAVAADPMLAGLALEQHFIVGAVPNPDLQDYIVSLRGEAVVEHLLRVACGLNSIMLGEHEVLGQVGDALENSRERGTVGPLLERLFQAAIRAGRRARAETEIGRGGTSLAHAAVQAADRAVPEDERGRVVILGAGRMGAMAAARFQKGAWDSVVVVNRSTERAEELAATLGCDFSTLEALPELLGEARVVVAATSAGEPVVGEAELSLRLAGDADSLLLVDLGNPRNVASGVQDLDGVQVLGLDELREVGSDNLRQRENQIAPVEAIVDEEFERFRAWLAHRSVVPLVRRMRESFREVAMAEMQRHARHFSDEDQASLERYTEALINKLLHYPTVQLREIAGEDHPDHEARRVMLEDLFVEAGWGSPR
jgi:glutamyl-tRNA reductase